MRVLHVISSVAPREGGPATAIRGMTDALARLGLQVDVATTDADGADRLRVPLREAVTRGSVTYRYFPRSVAGTYKLSLPLASWLWRHTREYDVVHVHGIWQWASIPACRAAWRAGVPYVLRTLGMLDPWSLSVRRLKKTVYLRFIEGKHLRRAAAIHVTAPSEQEGLSALGLGGTARVIPLGVDAPEAPCVRRRPVLSGTTRLLFLARLHPKKGLPLLLMSMARAVAAGADLELTVAGDGPNQYVRGLRERAAALGLGGRVRFVGHVSGAAKWELLASTDVFVLPSNQENFGIAVAEALSIGVPVVVSEHVGIASDIAEAGAGVVLPLCVDSWTSALSTMAADPGSRERMRGRAAELASERYTWARCAASLARLYGEVRQAQETGATSPSLVGTGTASG